MNKTRLSKISKIINSSQTLSKWFYNKHIRRVLTRFVGEDVMYYLELKISTASRPCFKEMTDILGNIPEFYEDGIKNSECAVLFHKYLLNECDINAKGSYLYGTPDSEQLQINIWANDNDTSSKLLNGTRYQAIRPSNECFYAIIECLCKALEQHDQKCYNMVTELKEMQKKRDSGEAPKEIPSLHITLFSLAGIYKANLFCRTAKKATDTLRREFPEYKRLDCFPTYALDDGINTGHEFLFFTPEDEKKAVERGDVEKMTKITYDIVCQYDELRAISKEYYHPKTSNYRMYTREELFTIARSY